MKPALIALIAISALAFNALSQPLPPDTLWTRTYGGHYRDTGYYVQQTLDGGYILTGDGSSSESGSIFLIKTDSAGNREWRRTYGDFLGGIGRCVQQTRDGGFIITGMIMTNPNRARQYVFLIKTDTLGNQQWIYLYGGSGNNYGYSVQQTVDSGYIIVGYTTLGGTESRDLLIIKTDSLGIQEWFQTVGGTSSEEGYSIQQTTDGGYIMTGYTCSFGTVGTSVYLVKTDTLGNQQWYRTFNANGANRGYCLQQTEDGGYIIAGETYIGNDQNDVYLIKTDSLGNQQWCRTFGGNRDDRGRFVRQTFDNGYIIAGYTRTYGAGDNDICLIKTDEEGNQVWFNTYGRPTNDYGYCVQQVDDGGYIVIGSIFFCSDDWDIFLVRTAAETAEHTIVLKQNREFPSMSNPIITTNETEVPFITHHSSFIISANPNPFNSSVALRFELPDASQIELKIFDISGREVASLVNGQWSTGEHEVSWNAEGMPSGIYFAKLMVDGRWSMVAKLLLLR